MTDSPSILPAIPGVAARAVGLTLLYFALTGEISIAETVAGAVIAIAASLLQHATATAGRAYAAVTPAAFTAIPHLAWSALRDCLRISRAIVQALAGHTALAGQFFETAFAPGEPDAAARTRRGLRLAAFSLAPNAYVVDIRYPRPRLLGHRLLPNGGR
jgi:hypothetical protein